MNLATEPLDYELPAGLRGREMTGAEIAAALGVSLREVHQIEQTAMRKLRRSPEARALLAFVDFPLEDMLPPVTFYGRQPGERRSVSAGREAKQRRLLYALIDEQEGLEDAV